MPTRVLKNCPQGSITEACNVCRAENSKTLKIFYNIDSQVKHGKNVLKVGRQASFDF
jgi:hypothetical protein